MAALPLMCLWCGMSESCGGLCSDCLSGNMMRICICFDLSFVNLEVQLRGCCMICPILHLLDRNIGGFMKNDVRRCLSIHNLSLEPQMLLGNST